MSLPARLGDELADLFRTALLWVGLLPAVSPIHTVASAVPGVPDAPGWLSLAVTAVAVGVVNYASPGVSLLRVWAAGFVASFAYVAFVAAVVGFTTLGSAGGSWPLAAAYAVCWLCSVGFAVALVSRRVREKMVARVDPASRGRSE